MWNCKQLDEDDSQTQTQLVEQLGVNQQAVFNQLREMGKIQKTGTIWVEAQANGKAQKHM